MFTEKIKNVIRNRKGLGVLGLSDSIGTGIAAIFWFYLASVIQPEEYGKIFYIIAIVSIGFNLSNISTQNTNIVFTAKKKNLESSLLTVALIFTGIASAVLFIIFNQIDLIILIFGYVINTIGLGYLIGKQYYRKYAVYLLTQKILTVILGFLFLELYGADGIIMALGISYFGFIVILFNIYRKVPLNFKEFKNNFSFILNNYFIKIVGVFKENIDKILIVPLVGFSFLGNYSLALQCISVLSIANIFFYKYILTNDSRQIANKHLKKIYLLFNTLIAIIASIFLPILIPNFFPSFTEIHIISVMVYAIIPTAIISIRISELLGAEKSKPVVYVAIIGTLVMTVGMLVLVPALDVLGAAIAYLSSYTSIALFLIFYPQNSPVFPIYLRLSNMLQGSNISKYSIVRKVSKKIISNYHPDSVVINGLKFSMDAKDSNKFSTRKNYPKPILHYLQSIKKGDTVIDVGANIGYFTLLFAKLVGETGKVISIEPDPENFKILNKNIEQNNFKNVITFQNAVSNNNEIVFLKKGKSIAEHKISIDDENEDSIDVKCIKIDEQFSDLKKVKLLKSDTEGNEIKVLKGCEQMLQENKIENIMIEFSPKLIEYYNHNPKQLYEILKINNFKIFDVEDENLDNEINYEQLIKKCQNGGTDLFCSK